MSQRSPSLRLLLITITSWQWQKKTAMKLGRGRWRWPLRCRRRNLSASTQLPSCRGRSSNIWSGRTGKSIPILFRLFNGEYNVNQESVLCLYKHCIYATCIPKEPNCPTGWWLGETAPQTVTLTSTWVTQPSSRGNTWRSATRTKATTSFLCATARTGCSSTAFSSGRADRLCDLAKRALTLVMIT